MAGYDYAKCHVYWTIPPACLLWLVGRKWRTDRDVFKTGLLIAIAVVSTTPWDSFLIRHHIWSYPPSSVAGYTLFDIPLEEVFFFVVQTYITASLYHLLSKPIIHPFYLNTGHSHTQARRRWWAKASHVLGVVAVAYVCQASFVHLALQGKQYYLSLILAWAGPFLLLLWTLAGPHILSLPWYTTLLPIALPTAYLWWVDTVALRRGTWVIESATKLEVHLWEGLDVEEAVFFLLTNVLIVFGLIACDYSFALHDAFPNQYTQSKHPTPLSIVAALLQPYSPAAKIKLQQYQFVQRILQAKSKSFSFAAVAFEGRLQLALPCLYAVCRVADDAVDLSPSYQVTQDRIQAILSLLQQQEGAAASAPAAKEAMSQSSPLTSEEVQAILLYNDLGLPLHLMEELLAGFETDAQFAQGQRPIQDDAALQLYCERVASSVGEMCVRLAWQAHGCSLSEEEKHKVISSARAMGRALQLVNIARDVPEDLRIGRIYLPGQQLRPCTSQEVDHYSTTRLQLVDQSKEIAKQHEYAINMLPSQARMGMKAACRLYLLIGDKVRDQLRQDVLKRARTGTWEKIKVLATLTIQG